MRALLLCVVMLFGAAVAQAETGRGDAPRSTSGDIRNDVVAPLLADIGGDVVRFSSAPALGGRGYVMTFAGAADGAWAEVIWVFGAPRSGWRISHRQRFELEPNEYEYIAGMVDDAFALGEPNLRPDADTMIICTDGPGYLTERLMDGSSTWMAGQCGDEHPNDVIADYLFSWALSRLGGY